MLQLYGKTITNKKRAKRSRKQTVILYGGNDIEKSCKKREIVGTRTIKSADEAGMERDNFVHVLESYMTKTKLPVIVKIHDSEGVFVRRELRAYESLKGFENSVQKICDFSCMDEKARWEYMIDSPVSFCNNKTDSLHFFVLEYIEDGDIYNFFDKLPPKNVICSFLLQCTLAIAVMAYKYHISHEDLNSGNVLVGKTDKTRMHYKILDKEYRIPTYGITPKFVDYGFSSEYMNTPNVNDILSDVYTCIGSMASYIRDPELKSKIVRFVDQNVLKRDVDFEYVIMGIREAFV